MRRLHHGIHTLSINISSNQNQASGRKEGRKCICLISTVLCHLSIHRWRRYGAICNATINHKCILSHFIWYSIILTITNGLCCLPMHLCSVVKLELHLQMHLLWLIRIYECYVCTYVLVGITIHGIETGFGFGILLLGCTCTYYSYKYLVGKNIWLSFYCKNCKEISSWMGSLNELTLLCFVVLYVCVQRPCSSYEQNNFFLESHKKEATQHALTATFSTCSKNIFKFICF